MDLFSPSNYKIKDFLFGAPCVSLSDDIKSTFLLNFLSYKVQIEMGTNRLYIRLHDIFY